MTLTTQRYDRALSSTSLRCVHIRANIAGYKYHVADKRTVHSTASKIGAQCVSETTGYRLEAVAVAAVATTSTAMYKHQHLCLQSTVECIHSYTHAHNFTHQTNDSHTERNVRCDVMWWVQCMFSYRYKRFDSIVSVCNFFVCGLQTQAIIKKKRNEIVFIGCATYFHCQRLHACVFLVGMPSKPNHFQMIRNIR